jgi:hypothetical protein
MSSVVFICNLALGNIGKESISSINEASAEARACKQFYDIVLDTALQSYPWRWAVKTEAMAQVVNTKENRWLFAYQRPSDCLKIIRVVDESLIEYMPYGDGIKGGNHDYEIEGETIYCDLSPAYLQYTQKMTDPARFPPMFVDALGMALSARIAYPITRDLKIRADAVTLASQAMEAAKSADANEVRETSDWPSEVIEARSPGFPFPRRQAID